jgi:hypothetical protein
MTTKNLNIKDFAERVERLCDFLLRNLELDGSADVVVIQRLKEEAADIQFKDSSVQGLDDFMRGISPKSKES